nr:kelch-like protein 26 [Lytechinus pictus]
MDLSAESPNFLLNDLSPRKNPVKLNVPASFGRRSPLKPSGKSSSFISSSLSSIHGGRVLKELNSFRNQGLLCDVSIVANGTKIDAHRTILAANSKYLRDQLLRIASRGKSPVNKPEIQLDGISVGTLRSVTSFMYTSELGEDCSIEHILDVFCAAVKLKMPELKQHCVEQTRNLLKPDIYLLALRQAGKAECEKITTSIEKYIAENFMLLVNSSDDFLNIPAANIMAISQLEEFQKNGSAAELLHALISWIKSDPEARIQHAESLLDAIRFHDILPSAIRVEISSIEYNLVRLEDAPLKQKLLSCIASHTQDCIRPSKMTQAPGKTSFLLVGGDDTTGAPIDRTFTFNPMVGDWTEGTQMPICRLDHASAVLNGLLYVAGGQHSAHSKAADSIGTVHAYDTKTSTWTQLCPMQKRRAVFTMNSLNNRLYAVGGKNAHGSLASVEFYDPASETWTYVSHMYTGLFGHASVVLDDKIYVSGGVVAGRHFTNALQCYHPKSDKWIHMSPMSSKRAFHMMGAVGGKLYVFGGNTRNSSAKRIDCESMECYDPDTDRWETIENMPRPVCFAAAAALEDRIYVFGGYSGKKAKRYADIQCFDIQSRTWSLVGQLPDPIMRLSISALQAPSALIVH